MVGHRIELAIIHANANVSTAPAPVATSGQEDIQLQILFAIREQRAVHAFMLRYFGKRSKKFNDAPKDPS